MSSERSFTMTKLKNCYTGIAAILLTSFLVMIIINIVLSGVLSLKHRFLPDPGPIWRHGWRPILAVYPGWDKKEIVQLLNEIYFERSIEFEPLTQFREHPREGKYVTVDPAGFRAVKNQGAWPPDAAFTNIFVFGGSTTFGYGVANDQTIASYLQELASTERNRKPVRVYNFGRGYYFSSQETALFSHLLVSNIVPDIAVFIDGMNDFVYLDGRPEYTDQLTQFMNGRQTPVLLTESATSRAAGFVRARLLPVLGHSAVSEPSDPIESRLKATIARWLRNKKATEALASSFGVRPVFVWQPSPTYKYNLRYHAFFTGDFAAFGAHSLSRLGYELMNHERVDGTLGADFLWLGDIQENSVENLYVDLLHYKPDFAREIARNIYGFIQKPGPASKSDDSAFLSRAYSDKRPRPQGR